MTAPHHTDMTITKNHATLALEVKAHVEADAIMRGHYWNAEDHTGCFIGCLAHSDDANVLVEKYGLTLPLVKIAENIFESLSPEDGRDFFAALPDAVARDGKDLSLVHWKFLTSELRSLPAMPSHIQDVIDPVVKGLEILADGGNWAAADAAYAAADAAYAAAHAARAAADAARAAAHAAHAAADAAHAAHAADAAYAAYAADAAAYTADAAAVRKRQAALFLRLIEEAE